MASPNVQFGTTIGRYQVVRRLGAGGMAVVCLAHDPRLNRDVAIKILGHKLTDQPGYRTYLQREARAVARLNHPHVAQVYDVLEHQNQTCFVMEYVQGETLAELLESGPLPLPEVLAARRADGLRHGTRARPRCPALRSQTRQCLRDQGRRHQGGRFRSRAAHG